MRLKNDGMQRNAIPAVVQALLAALLFGVSTPISKFFLGEIEPVPLVAFLYLGSGIGLAIFQIIQRDKQPENTEASLKRSDIGWLTGAVLTGGVIAPIILLFSLRDTPGAIASLLLNFEGVATTLIAASIFKEAVSRRAWLAIIVITAASILLSVMPDEGWGISLSAVGVLVACFFWGVDNNFTRNISSKNPVSIVMIKGFAAGTFSLFLAIILGNQLPDWTTIIKAMLLGSLSYGLSITLFIRAMRGLGAARTSALYGTAPLAGVTLSFVLLNESGSSLFLIALLLMIVGAVLLVYEEHHHSHMHEAVVHEHWHQHDDDHHLHHHDDLKPVRAHSHEHKHDQQEHTHHHMPDIHHRHTHNSDE